MWNYSVQNFLHCHPTTTARVVQIGCGQWKQEETTPVQTCQCSTDLNSGFSRHGNGCTEQPEHPGLQLADVVHHSTGTVVDVDLAAQYSPHGLTAHPDSHTQLLTTQTHTWALSTPHTDSLYTQTQSYRPTNHTDTHLGTQYSPHGLTAHPDTVIPAY